MLNRGGFTLKESHSLEVTHQALYQQMMDGSVNVAGMKWFIKEDLLELVN